MEIMSGTWRGEKVIDLETLQDYIRRGLSYVEMSDEFFKEHGVRRSPVSFTAAIARKGLEPPHPAPRYEDEIPWRMRGGHGDDYKVRMLRLLGRRNAGQKLRQDDAKRLDSFLKKLDEAGAVVHYDPETEQGFWLVPREPQDGDGYVRRPAEG